MCASVGLFSLDHRDPSLAICLFLLNNSFHIFIPLHFDRLFDFCLMYIRSKRTVISRSSSFYPGAALGGSSPNYRLFPTPTQHARSVSACFPPHCYVMLHSTPDLHTHTRTHAGRWNSVHVYQRIRLQYNIRMIDGWTLIAHNIVTYKSSSCASYCVLNKLHCH